VAGKCAGKKEMEEMTRNMADETRIVFVSGASGGIGLHICEFLLEAGYQVAMQYHNNGGVLQPLLKKFPDKAHAFYADLSDKTSIDRLTKEVLQSLEKIDIVIHSAGVSSAGMCWKIEDAEWERVLQMNLTAPMQISRAFIPEMRYNKWGRIIFVSSVVAQTGVMGSAAYAASKSGLFGLCRAMASDLGSSGITVNVLSPGYMDTGMIQVIPPQVQDQLKKDTPTGTLGNPMALVRAIEFLIHSDNSFTTGQILSVNGGLHM
jgi:NAD(P)-dependent dehydrogenase (short-subunit alcohol dehydrogenase family)